MIARGESGAEPIASTLLGRSISVDDEFEVVFQWGGTEYIDVLVRQPGTPPAAWVDWRCFRVPRSDDGLRRVRFSDDELEHLVELWLSQQFDPEAARAVLAERR